MAMAKRPTFMRATTGTTLATMNTPHPIVSEAHDQMLRDESNDQTPFLHDHSARASSEVAPKNEVDHDVEDGGDLRPQRQARTKSCSRLHALAASPIWLISTILLLTILIAQNSIAVHRAMAAGSYEHGFATEIAALTPAIKIQKTRFKSAIRDLPNTTMHVPEPALDNKGRRFTGPASDDIDAAWMELIHGRYERFSDQEVAWLNDSDDFPPSAVLPLNLEHSELMQGEPGVYGGPDMLHSLHCLNGIRKHMDYEYYAQRGGLMGEPAMERLHMEHCIEQLRQAVLCHGDMTPVTLKPVYKGDAVVALLGQTEREHMCRDGEALAGEWRAQRVERGFAGE